MLQHNHNYKLFIQGIRSGHPQLEKILANLKI